MQQIKSQKRNYNFIRFIRRDFTLERRLHNFGRCGKWNFSLTTGTLMPANQERP